MGYVMSSFVIFLTVSLALCLVNPSEWGSPLATLIVSINSNTGEINLSGLWNQLLKILTISFGTGIIVGLFTSESQYGLFAGFVTFMVGFSVLPINFFVDNTIPFFIKVMVGVPLSVIYVLGLIGWFRGVEL